MNRRPSTRIVRTGSASRGGIFTKQPDPNEGYTFQSGQVENTGQEQAQTGGNKTMNESNLVSNPNITYSGGTYTPDEDVVATLSDGRTIQLALKGTPMPLHEAVAKGLVDEKGNPQKQDTKAAGPSETKETPKKPVGSAPSQSDEEAKK